MKPKIIVIVWQSYYNMFYRASKEIKEFNIKVYSARILDANQRKFEEVLEELNSADVLFLYRSSESFWETLEKYLKTKNYKTKIICIGHDPSYFLLSNVSPEIIEKAYKYVVINGKENIKNLYLFLANKLLKFPVSYSEPLEIPWEGIYHPKANRIFTTLDEYLEWYDIRGKKGVVGILFSRHYWINGNTEVEDLLIEELEKKGFGVISAFAYSLKDKNLGTKGSAEVVEEFFFKDGKPIIDAMIKLISFFLCSEKSKDLDQKDIAEGGVKLLKRLNVPVFSPISSYYKTIKEWEREELNMDIGWSVALPEFEGVIEPIIISAQKEGEADERIKAPIVDRIKKLVDRIERWIELRKTPVEKRKVVFVLHNNPCASVEATVGAGANLDTLESVSQIMKRMKEVGYKVSPPENGKELIEEIMKRKAISEFRWTTVDEIVAKGGAIAFVDKEKYLEWFNELPEKTRERVVSAWGNPPGEYKNGIPPAMLYKGKMVITGVKYGNALVCVQPKRGCAGARCDGRVCKILHDPDVPPPHQYIATYKWLSREFKANVIIHVGTHGNLEFLPGKGVGLSSACFPDICIDTIPHLYIYNADNPPEGTIAKRRAYAVLVDHMQTVMTESGLYDELLELDRLLGEYEEVKRKDKARVHVLEHMIISAIKKVNLDKEIKNFDKLPFEKIVEEAHNKLSLIRNTQIQDGMHVFGKIPEGQRKIDFIYAILRYDTGEEASLKRKVAKLLGYDLSELLSNPQKIDPKTKKSYGAILEEIDKLGKEIVKYILAKEKEYEGRRDIKKYRLGRA